ncbi:Eco57I restriction-modification methylase domain-containing protein [Maribacter arenosus]|uniref:site-specific DNA-methyltransferase (adenine-specific) n=1 Tax=Maribacter arenosus TaxID=1854708 RepID=A0ABR7VB05_9FLAO|nr:Eco57I restriction-modification methylase domain-containing protein [Maribacter arenosus]MBD0850518.1 Eco57I restriction-modification methylase domain-containing protein [Maribacter arenosus]
MLQINYNPDVLSCLANLSNDEVFTPPKLVNEILDLLPQELFQSKETTFLDPVTKSGVFLREIAKRLNDGLKDQIPDQQERVNHIFTKQVFGIAITELTSLLARRSTYCSKKANGEFSVTTAFATEQGKIKYDRLQHTWQNGKCTYCGASEEVYSRTEDLETYAYQFIHTDKPQNIFNMKFDVIIGNPPYQLNDGGGTGSSAKPIYQHFIEQAKRLKPRYLSMIIPARWYSGGKGLDSFRNEMLQDRSIKELVDYVDSRECFPGVDIAGGICYFLWDSGYNGMCKVITVRKGEKLESVRYLNEFDTFVRDNIAVGVIHKVKSQNTKFLNSLVSSRMPFGLNSKVRPSKKGELELISSGGRGKISKSAITSGKQYVDKWKVLLSKASNDHGGQPDKEGKRRIFSRIEVMPPGTVCTESYLVVGAYSSEMEAINLTEYLKTKFCRFLVSTILLTQNITKSKFIFVPDLNMQQKWTDDHLNIKYNLSKDEINFIETVIREMN